MADQIQIRKESLEKSSSTTQKQNTQGPKIEYQKNTVEELCLDNTDQQQNSLIDTSGIYANATDYQKIALSNLYIFDDMEIPNDWLNKDGTINKKIIDLYNSIEDKDSNIKKNLKILIDYGYGEYELVEVQKDEADMYINDATKKQNVEALKYTNDAVVLKDKEGNYIIHYSCTNSSEVGDLLFDAHQIVNSNVKDKLDTGATIAEKNANRLKKINDKKAKKAAESKNENDIIDYAFSLFGENWLSGASTIAKWGSELTDNWYRGVQIINEHYGNNYDEEELNQNLNNAANVF